MKLQVLLLLAFVAICATLTVTNADEQLEDTVDAQTRDQDDAIVQEGAVETELEQMVETRSDEDQDVQVRQNRPFRPRPPYRPKPRPPFGPRPRPIPRPWPRPRPFPRPPPRPRPFPRPRPRPRPRMESDVEVEQQVMEERAMTDGQSNLLAETMPESKNYDVVADPFCVCCCGQCCNHGRRSIEVETRDSDDKLPEITVLGSETELKMYSDKADLLELHQSPVARAELVTRPLDPATPGQVSDALGGLQHAVVATLTDGRRFLVVKGNQKGEGSETIVILADHMTDDWTKVTTKDVSQSTLGDFVKAGGKGFDALEDNGTQAAARIMALP